MPVVNMSLNNTSQSFVRPVVIDIVNQVMAATKIDKKVPIFFGGEMGIQQAAGSGVNQADNRRARFEALRRMVIEEEEVYAEDQHTTDIVGRMNNIPVFADQALDVYVLPTYTTSTMNIKFRYETRSKEECLRWRQEMTMKYMMLRTSLMHQITYSYTLPEPIWELIENIYECREKVAGYGEMLGEYLNKCMTNRLTVIGNENGRNRQFAITEKQDRIQGFFDFTTDPHKPEYEEDRGVWVIEFTYSFTYQRPVGVDAWYPIMVHNQFLKDKFIDFDPATLTKDPYLRDIRDWSLGMFETNSTMGVLKPQYPYLRIPEEDDFNITNTSPGTGTFLLVMMKLEENGDNTFNLRDLGNTVIDPDILKWLEDGEYKHIGMHGNSVIQAEVYKGKTRLADPTVSIDKDLNVKLNVKLDMRCVYRIRFSLVTEFSFLQVQAFERLNCHPRAFVRIMGAINETLLYRPDFQRLGNQRHIFPWQLTRVYEVITGSPITNGYGGYTSGRCQPGWDAGFLAIPERVIQEARRVRKKLKTVMNYTTIAYNQNRS